MTRIKIPREKQNKIINDHSSEVLNKLKKEVNKLNETLRWKSNLQECFPRFRTVKQYGDEYFVEIGFGAKNVNYRAILGWLHEKEVFIVLTVIKKTDHYQTSKQKKIFNQIDKNGKKIMERERENNI